MSDWTNLQYMIEQANKLSPGWCVYERPDTGGYGITKHPEQVPGGPVKVVHRVQPKNNVIPFPRREV